MKYSEEELKALLDRWDKPLLVENGEPTEFEGCTTFQTLLDKKLDEIKKKLEPGLNETPKFSSLEGRKSFYRRNWKKSGAHKELTLLMDLLVRFRLEDIEEAREQDDIFLPESRIIDFRGADLSEKILLGAIVKLGHFEGADCSFLYISYSDCRLTHFEGSNCTGINFKGSNCSWAHFEGTQCNSGRFQEADCTGTQFSGAAFCLAKINTMIIDTETEFGMTQDQIEASNADSSFLWRIAAEVNLRVKHLFKSNGYYRKANDHHYQEMVCQRHYVYEKKKFWKIPLNKPCQRFDWIFLDLIAGYGIKWLRPLGIGIGIIFLWGILLTLSMRHPEPLEILDFCRGFYYSIIAFTTLGFGNIETIPTHWGKFLIGTEALAGTFLMPLFLVAYARRILQD